jgi:response regulator of citrate/malate metabolism
MIRTLVVEDDVRVADVVRSYVERLPGFAVVAVAYRGADAIEIADREELDLVLLDFYLPDMKGLDVCRTLRADARRPVDVIAVTAARDVDTVRNAVAQGVVQYLIKPFTFATFRDKLEHYAAYRERLQNRREADQDMIDGLFGTLRGSASGHLPKGLSRSTYELVATVLRDAGRDLTAVEVAEAAGLSRVAVRRYLDYLTKQGLATLTMRYGTRGRPEHRYRWGAENPSDPESS